MNFGNHCSTRAFGEAQKTIAFPLLQCPAIGQDIAFCQKQGVKVLLTVANVSALVLESDEDGVDRATMVWNMFLGGLDSNRPFGDIILDGVDLLIRDKGAGYLAYARHLRSLMDKDRRKNYLLSLSPQASFNDAFSSAKFSSQNVLAAPEIFDYMSLYALSSPDCTWDKQAEFWDCLQGWIEWAQGRKGKVPGLYLALPASNQNAIGAPGDYASINSLIEKKFYSKFSKQSFKAYFRGIMILDYSLDRISRPCEGMKKTYSEIFYSLMQGNNIKCEAAEEQELDASQSGDHSDNDGDWNNDASWGEEREGEGIRRSGKNGKFREVNWGDSSSAGAGIRELRLSYFFIVILACLLF